MLARSGSESHWESLPPSTGAHVAPGQLRKISWGQPRARAKALDPLFRERVPREKLLEVLSEGPAKNCNVDRDEQTQQRLKEETGNIKFGGCCARTENRLSLDDRRRES